MMKLSSKLTAVMLIMTLSSCTSVEDVAHGYPYVSELEHTGCLTHMVDVATDGDRGRFEMIKDGGKARCRFTSLDYPCDFGMVNVRVTYDSGVLTVVEYPSHDNADCRCETEASFVIENVPEGDLMLRIYHGDTSGRYDVGTPGYSGRIEFAGGRMSVPY